jgi:DNA-binding transcriptional MerR regulator
VPEEVYRPAEAAHKLGIAANTLRVYAARFAPMLSRTARREGTGPGHRQYTEEDLTILARAHHLLATGATYEQVRARLAGGPTVDTATSEEPQTAEATTGLTAMQDAVAAWRSLAEDRAAEVAALRDRVNVLEQQLVALTISARGSGRGPSGIQTAGTEPSIPEMASRPHAAPGSAAADIARANQPTRASSADSAQKGRWWNRVFSGDPDEGDRGAG